MKWERMTVLKNSYGAGMMILLLRLMTILRLITRMSRLGQYLVS